MSLDVAPALRTAILANSTITGLLSTYLGAASVHTRMPVPDGVTYPHIVIGPNVSVTDYDALTVDRPTVVRNIYVFGELGGSTQDDHRDVDTIAYALRTLFHRKKEAITVTGYDVISIDVLGPTQAPASDDEYLGRLVSLTIRLRSSG